MFSRVRDIFKGGSIVKKKKVYHNVKLDNPEEFWEIIGELGDGAYGKVYKARSKITKELAALKQVALESEEDLDSFMIEIDILAECKHPNIVELLEAYHYDGKLWMYLEYCDGGAVDSIMVDLDRPLKEKQIAYLCRNLCEALSYIHANKVIHRDIKAGNVLLTMDGGVKLADFGVSAKNKNTYDKRGTFIGTPYWLAPEVILCETFIDAKYDYKADIWSLGISLIEFAQMDPPNHEVSPVRVMLKIQKSDAPRLDYPSRWSKDFNDFISKCLVKDPVLRPTSEELLKHRFLTQNLNEKPIKELLLEYNAEVLVEDVDDETEDHDQSRVSTVCGSPVLNNNQNKLPNAVSSEKSNAIVADGQTSPKIDENKESGQVISTDRRLSKGPAPKPPSTVISPRKGPAPSVPIENNSTPIITVTPSPTSEKNFVISEIENKNEDISSDIPSSSMDTDESIVVKEEVSSLPVYDEQEKVVTESVKKEDNKATDNVTINCQKVNGSIDEKTDRPSAIVNISSVKDEEEFDFRSIPVPVTVSVLPSDDGPAIKSVINSSLSQLQEPSDVIMASISSEGTVIVRTPTPTPASHEVPKKENVVTYTVAEEIGLDKSSEDATSSYSLDEDEAHAVLMLENAIDSALDAIDETSGLSSPSSLTDDSFQIDGKGDIIIVNKDSNKSSETTETEVKLGQKLDESEVMISNSSILGNQTITSEDDTGSRFETTLEETMESELKEPHVSVINVVEDDEEIVESPLLDEQVVVVSSHKNSQAVIDAASLQEEKSHPERSVKEENAIEESKKENQVVIDASVKEVGSEVDNSVSPSDAKKKTDVEIKHLSLTIEGTTIEATDVDDLDSTSSNLQQSVTKTLSTSSDSGFAKDSPVHVAHGDEKGEEKSNGIRRNSSSRASDRSDSDTTSTIGSDKENRLKSEDVIDDDSVQLRKKPSQLVPPLSVRNERNNSKWSREEQESIALRKKTRKRTRRFVIDGVVFTTTTSKVIYGDDEDIGTLSSAHLARKQEMRELKVVQRQEQKQFQELAVKASAAKLDQEKKFEIEKANLIRNYDSQVEALTRQQKQMVEKTESRQDSDLKIVSKRTRNDQEKELKSFREHLKQDWKLLKQEIDAVPKDRRKETLKHRKDALERDQAEQEKAFLEKLNETHETALKKLNDKHRKHIALKERQFLEEKHQLFRARESSLWDMEERQIQDRHQLAKEQLKDIYFLQRFQMAIRHNVEQEQVKRLNGQKEDGLVKTQQVEKRQLPKRIRQEMRTRDKMFREQMRISMTTLTSHEVEKDQLKKFQELEKIKYDKERKRAEMKHQKQLEELRAGTDASIKELVHLQNEKGKLLTEHESYKLKSLDEEYQKELRDWKANLAPRKQKLEEGFERQLGEQDKFYGDYLDRDLGLSATPNRSSTNMRSRNS